MRILLCTVPVWAERDPMQVKFRPQPWEREALSGCAHPAWRCALWRSWRQGPERVPPR